LTSTSFTPPAACTSTGHGQGTESFPKYTILFVYLTHPIPYPWHPRLTILFVRSLTISPALPHITISQHDGASDSKPTSYPPTHAATSPTRGTTHSPGVRKRIANLFTPKKKKANTTNADDDDFYGDVVIDESPMRVLSPRATNFEPLAPVARGRSISFKRKEEGKIHKKAKSMGTPLQVQNRIGEEMSGSVGAGYTSISQELYQPPNQAQPRKDSVGLGGLEVRKSPTREAALTSHPVGRIEEVDEEESHYETPASRGVSGVSGYFGTQ
jgi:hypothetical protein